MLHPANRPKRKLLLFMDASRLKIDWFFPIRGGY
jgi:hypothetical protein